MYIKPQIFEKIKRNYAWVTLLLIFLLGLVFRLFRISELPAGLFPDESANGLDINLMEQGQLQPFYERGNGREALFFYLLWGSVKIFGRTPMAHHLTSAIVGSLAVLACYLVAKELWTIARASEHSAKILALSSALILAVSSWHVVLSRTAFRANLIPLLSALTLWALLKSRFGTHQQSKTLILKSATSSYKADESTLNPDTSTPPLPSSLLTFHSQLSTFLYPALFGIFFALGFYTYIAFRIMAPLIVMLVLWPLLSYWWTNGIKTLILNFWKPFVVAVISFCLVISPLFHYFYTHPGSFVGRSGQVSVFNPELNKGDLVGTMLSVSRDSLLAYFTKGDLNWRHNISGFPFISPLLSTFFGLGLLLCLYFAVRYFFAPIKRQHNFVEYLLLGWFLSMLLPVITTAEGIPHGLRAIGTIPVVFIITIYGMYKVFQLVQKHTPRLKNLLLTTYCLLLLGLPFQTYQLYFVRAQNSPEYYEAFRGDLTVVSDYLNKNGDRNTTYLILDKFSVQTTDYLTTKIGKTSCDRDTHYRALGCTDDPQNKPYIQVDPERSYLPEKAYYEGRPIWPNGLKRGDRVIFTQSSLFDIAKFKQAHPNVKLEAMEKNHLGEFIMAVFKIQ